MSIKDFVITKLFFPKTVVIDRPGIILSRTHQWWSGKSYSKRIVYYFEDNLVDMQLALKKNIGEERLSEIDYVVGKKIGYKYLYNIRKIRKLKEVLRYVSNILAASGISVAENFKFIDDRIIFEGEDNIVCRKTGLGSGYAGMLAGILTRITGKNFEAKKVRCCKNDGKCVVIASNKFDEIYKVEENYVKTQSKVFIKNTSERLASLSDFFKFKKIYIDRKGKLVCFGHTIAPTSLDFFDIMLREYEKNNLTKIYEKAIVKSVEKVMNDIIREDLEKKRKIKFLKNILSALGWGIIELVKIKPCIVKVTNPPQSYAEIKYYALFLNGSLNYIFNKRLKFKKYVLNVTPYPVTHLLYEE